MNPSNRMYVPRSLNLNHIWTGANLWPIACICALIGASPNLNATEDCEAKLQAHFLEKTRFVDMEALEQTSEMDLTEWSVKYSELQRTLTQRLAGIEAKTQAVKAGLPAGFDLAPAKEQLHMENASGLRDLYNRHNSTNDDLLSCRRYANAIQRILDRKHMPERVDPKAPAPQIMNLSITGKTDTQIMGEITRMTAHLKPGPDHQVLRFFPSAKEDVLRRHGIDFFGREYGGEDAWDEFGLESILSARGMLAHDGFYAVPHDIAADFGVRPNGEKIPFAMVADFMRGERSLAVYDMGQLEDFDTDYFLFRNPDQMGKSLLAIIRPRR